MTLQIDLTPEEEARLQRAAKRHGMEANAYLRSLIPQEAEGDMPMPKRRRKPICPDKADVQDAEKPKTGAEIIAYWEREGAFGSFTDGPDSPELARQLRQ